ncbi:MAG: alpha/beta fold hydrolase [Rhodoferax sp.]|nr:alpha/beta fold hydrolase [Rhodoferax sp.]
MKPLLLLIPGMFNTTAVWDAVRARIGNALDVRVADVLTQDNIAAMAHSAWDLVADQRPDRPLVVCGFSMGGYVAIEMLAQQGQRVQALALVDTSAAVETAQSLLLRERTISALERNFSRTVESIIAFSLHPKSLAEAACVQTMRQMMHSVGAEAAIRQNRAIMARSDHRAMLSAIRQPVLVVCGREDRVAPLALSQELSELIPHAQLAIVEGAGHQTPTEQGPALAELLLGFILSKPGQLNLETTERQPCAC